MSAPRGLSVCLAVLAVLLIVSKPCSAALDASLTSPLGSGGKPPQFVLFTHDDAVAEDTHTLMLAVTDGQKSATNDCPAVATMFVTTANGANDCELMMDLYNKGYEVCGPSQLKPYCAAQPCPTSHLPTNGSTLLGCLLAHPSRLHCRRPQATLLPARPQPCLGPTICPCHSA
jgi:hypothetical protein